MDTSERWAFFLRQHQQRSVDLRHSSLCSWNGGKAIFTLIALITQQLLSTQELLFQTTNTKTRKQTKPGTFHFFNCFCLGPLAFAWFSFYLFLKQRMWSLWLEPQRKLLQTSSPFSPRRCCWSVSKGGRVDWKAEHTTEPGQRKQKNISTATVFLLYSRLLACERMRHLHALQLDVTHAHTHLQGTQQSQTRSKRDPVSCVLAVLENRWKKYLSG